MRCLADLLSELVCIAANFWFCHEFIVLLLSNHFLELCNFMILLTFLNKNILCFKQHASVNCL